MLSLDLETFEGRKYQLYFAFTTTPHINAQKALFDKLNNDKSHIPNMYIHRI